MFFPVHQAIMLRIASMAFDPRNPALASYVELLTRLVSDGEYSDPCITERLLNSGIGRLGEKALDYMVFFVAPALVARPQITPFARFKLLTALWCRYGRRTEEFELEKHDQLLRWFILALFGRHVTPDEVETWSKRCGPPLPPATAQSGSRL